MHEAAGMHLISTCTGNEVGSSYVLAFGSWITFVSCNALGVTLHIGIGDKTMDNGKQLIILAMMIIDSYKRLKDPYTLAPQATPWKVVQSRVCYMHLGPAAYLSVRKWSLCGLGTCMALYKPSLA